MEKEKFNAVDIMGADSFWMVNKKFARAFGIECALLAADLLSKEKYFREKGELIDDEWFFNTSANIETSTTLSYHKQKTALTVLVENGFVQTKLMGVPSKLHFKIFESQFSNFFNTRIEIFRNLYNNNKQIIINKNNIAESKNSADGQIHKLLIDTFHRAYEKIAGSKFIWDGKQLAAIKSIRVKMKKMFAEINNIENPSTDMYVAAFIQLLERAANDKWLANNFEPSIINMKFNNLKSKVNETNGQKYKSRRDQYVNND